MIIQQFYVWVLRNDFSREIVEISVDFKRSPKHGFEAIDSISTAR